jgi:hypothetical protein
MKSLAGAARTLGLIMNGWYSASQEIVFVQMFLIVGLGRAEADSFR